jgi:hypothetical protein
VAGVAVGQTLVFIREKSNPHDRNAIAAYTESGRMLGHVSHSDAAALAPILDHGSHAIAQVEEIVERPARLRVAVRIDAGRTPSNEWLSLPPSEAASALPTSQAKGIPSWFWFLLALAILLYLVK